MKALKHVVMLLCLSGTTASLHAQEARKQVFPLPSIERFEIHGTEDGLPSWKVNCILVVGGRVWAGTDRGLAVYEGKRWKVVPIGDTAPRQFVISLAADPVTGDVWAGTLHGLVRHSGGRSDSFTQVDSGLPNDVVYGVQVTQDAVWAATAAGLGCRTRKNGSWKLYDQTNTIMHEPWCYSVTDAPGRVFVGVWGGGVVEYDVARNTWKEHRDPDKEMELDLLPDDGPIHDVTSGVSWSDGVLWQATYFGLARYDGSRWRSWVAEKSGLVSDFINYVYARGMVAWLATDDGLCATDGDTWATWRREDDGTGSCAVTGKTGTRKQSTASALPHNELLGLYPSEKEIWIATSHGVARGVFSQKPDSHPAGPEKTAGR